MLFASAGIFGAAWLGGGYDGMIDHDGGERKCA